MGDLKSVTVDSQTDDVCVLNKLNGSLCEVPKLKSCVPACSNGRTDEFGC